MPPLRSHGLHLVNLASGSRGNCTWVGDGTHGVLIDCGISARQIHTRLEALGLSGAPIDAVLVTHEHSDHVAAAAILERRFLREGRRVPFLMTPGTHAALPDKVRPQNVHEVPPGSRIPWLGGWLESWPVPHDTISPVCWVVERQERRAGVLTDLGHAPRLVERVLASLDLAIVEFNHDEEMLLDGPYPWPLKQRVRGRHGHLSNHAAATLLQRAAAAGRLSDVLLGHLSQHNNTAELAHRAAEEAVHASGASVRLHLAQQDTPTPPVQATSSAAPLVLF